LAAYLTGTGEQWLIANYIAINEPLPPVDEFLCALKRQFTHSHHARRLRRTIEIIQQGPHDVLEYAAELRMILAEIGRRHDPIWAKEHVEGGLLPGIQHRRLFETIGTSTYGHQIRNPRTP
jgi:hypothetical protein